MGFKSILKTILPTLGAAIPLPPPFGQMAAAAIGKAIGVEGLTPDKAEDAIAAAQVKDPEILLKLKQVDADFQLQMAQLGFESAEKLEEIAAGDRASARVREVAVKDYTNRIIAYGIVVLTLSMEGYVLIWGTPAVDGVVLGRIMATLENALMLVLAYYFGSSSGSAQKTAMLAEQGK